MRAALPRILSVLAIAQLHFYLDDIFPDSIGRPIFRRRL
jgi:hypothetical protein